MSTQPAPAPVDPDTGFEDDLFHWFCPCDEDIGLCGTDISDADEDTDGPAENETVCVVCEDLVDTYCSRCGE